MARHDQRGRKNTFICSNCDVGECGKCVDKTRSKVFGRQTSRICTCEHHDWEAQIAGRTAQLVTD